MKALSVIFVCSIMLFGCSHVSASSPLPAAAWDAGGIVKPANSAYKLLYTFKGMLDGWSPQSSMLDVNGELYGTTYFGGTKMGGVGGEGTVYRVSTTGHERVIHRFKLTSGGRNPTTGLVNVSGTLYGTTEGSEYSSAGTVFSVTASGRAHQLYRFNPNVDGVGPQGLIAVNGKLYGTMMWGTAGSNCGPQTDPGCGTLFSLDTSGNERVIYTFAQGKDGQYVSGPPAYLNGTFYGTTEGGGKYGLGTIFAVSAAGKEHVVYSFKGNPDGRDPHGVIVVKGVLYGTTGLGGAHDLGTVFRATTGGQERVLYSFRGPADGRSAPHDGAYPYVASLIAVKDTLYGVTPQGGLACTTGSRTVGCGTAFAVASSGAERVLYRFGGGTDDGEPYGGLTYVNGRLYGTTPGFISQGYGTVFSLLP